MWELEDEGIQPDIASDKLGKSSSENRTSMTSTASAFSYGRSHDKR